MQRRRIESIVLIVHLDSSNLRVTRDYVLDELGPDAFNKSSDFRLSAWLAQQEDKHRIVIYQCDRELTQWTKLCIRHADVIFILADPTMPHIVTPAEESLEAYSMRTRKEMIFLHREDTKYPKGLLQIMTFFISCLNITICFRHVTLASKSELDICPLPHQVSK